MHATTPQSVSRRTFLGAAAAALFVGVTIQITGCSTEETSDAGSGNAQGSISNVANHGHTAVVLKAQLDAGGALTLDIKGSADHTHTLELTAEEMTLLKARKHVMKDTSATDHKHSVMFFG